MSTQQAENHALSQDGDLKQQFLFKSDKINEELATSNAEKGDKPWKLQSQINSDTADKKSQPGNASPSVSTKKKKKQEPGYMKKLNSKQPAPILKRTKGNQVEVEPFDIIQPEELKPMNKTRKVQYPMVLKRYQVEKNIKDYELDDFRQVMDYIVFKKDNDEIFSNNLKN